MISLLIIALTAINQQDGTARTSDSVELQVGSQSFDPAGTIRSDGNTDGSDIDVEDNLGLNQENSLTLGFRHQTQGSQGFRLGYSNVSFNGENTLNSSFQFNDQLFMAGETVESELKFLFLDFDLEYRLTRPQRNDFFNLVFGGRWIEFDGTIKTSSGLKNEEASFETGIPVVGVHFRKYLTPKLYVGGRWQGMEATMDDTEMQYLDGQVSLGVRPLRNFWLVGSYNDRRIDGTNNDDHLDMKFTGPKFGVQFYF